MRKIPRKVLCGKNFLFVFIIASGLLLFMLTFYAYDGLYYDDEQNMLRKIAEIRENLNYLKHLDKEKQKAFLNLHNQYKFLSAFDSRGPWSNFSSSKIGRQADILDGGAQLSLAQQDLSVPSIYDHLGYLLQQPGGLVPAVKVTAPNKSLRRNRAFVTIGVPTIRRNKVSYLTTTLHSLIDNLSPSSSAEVLIVVFIGEPGITDFVDEQLRLLNAEFGAAVESGLLEIIAPSAAFYPPDIDTLPSTFDDPPERMKWRTKQNLDYAYLMMYAQNRGAFYVQLEDDVITKENYLGTIKDFVARQENPWYLLEFSSLGFIGKLFRSRDLPLVINFILMFHREKPVDWLLDHIFFTRLCNPEKSAKHCQQTKNQYRLRYKPSLFQHIGVHSSLKGKVQKLKEKDFGKQPLHKAHDNPPAEATTSLKIYQKFTIESAYKGDSFFWGLLPQPGDWVNFTFKPPVRLEGFTLRSGNAEHPDDMFYNTSVEILASNSEDVQSYPITKDGFAVVGWFSATGTAAASLNTTGPVVSLRLVVHAESSNWVILSEIWIKTLVEN